VPATNADLAKIIDGTRRRIERDPANANFTYKASAESNAGPTSTITIGEHTFDVDEPNAFGGNGEAPGPPEYVLGGVLSCQIVTLRFWAAKLGLEVGKITSSAQGTLDLRGMFGFDDSTDAGFKDVTVSISIEGPHSRDEYQRLLDEVEKHCPMSDTIARAIATRTTLA
jgi:uncharacterized OsmC-like protein